MNKCSCGNCDLEVFENSNKCILHCEKDDWVTKHDPSSDEFDLGTEVIYFWDEKKVKKFWKKFKKLIEKKTNLSEKESYFRFDGFIFPKMDQNTFKDYTFDCDLVFTQNCSFEGDIDFFQTIFNRQIYFNDCKIKGKVSFGKSIFKDRFTFNNMKEIKEVFFKHTEFKEKVEFKKSHCEEVDFENTTFEDLADFNKTCFNEINFYKTTFKDISVFTETIFNKKVDFKHTTFEKLSIFRNSEFIDSINLKDAIFKEKANFLEIKTDVSNRETARIIKDSFEQQNNIIEANKYYALEMKEREKELDFKKDFFEWLVFKIHGLSSNHSQDSTLALFWIINLTFFYSYLNIQPNDKILVFKIIFSCIAISVIACMTIKIPEENKERRWLTTIPTTIVCYVFYGYLVETDWQLSEFSKNLNPFSIMRGDEPITLGTLIFKIIIAYLIYQLIISIRQNTRRK
ncbi:pentapeptide repeat-containing protein [Aliarcobacter butzleri]|uniref:pentapeptide repeat-containing protein n=1 Tax=Aliarcobacter butzleri TaxID=28197 RepID=UPI003B228D00